MSTLRGPAQLADLQGALCVSPHNLTGAGGDFFEHQEVHIRRGKAWSRTGGRCPIGCYVDTPKGEVPVDYDVGRAFSCKYSGGDGEHVHTTAKPIGEKKNTGVTLGRDRQWPKIVHAYRNARSRREGNRNDGPSNRQSRCLPRLVIEAIAQPPMGSIWCVF